MTCKRNIKYVKKYNRPVNTTHQCRRKACKKADKPSIMRRMATVRMAKKQNTMARRKKPPRFLEERPMCITMDHSTSDSSKGWKQGKAENDIL